MYSECYSTTLIDDERIYLNPLSENRLIAPNPDELNDILSEVNILLQVHHFVCINQKNTNQAA
jgi:hypothetical protein